MTNANHGSNNLFPDITAPIPGHPDWLACADGHIYRSDGRIVSEHQKEAGENRLRVSCPVHGYDYVAKLIAHAFLGPNALTYAVIHRNRVPWDNRLSNLRLVKEAGSNSNLPSARRLSSNQLEALHTLLRRGVPKTRIALILGVSPRCVRQHARRTR